MMLILREKRVIFVIANSSPSLFVCRAIQLFVRRHNLFVRSVVDS